MRKEIPTKIHAGHQGRKKCKQRARQVVFWPGINSDINNIVDNCETCQRPQHKYQKEPLKPYPVPTRPWQVVGTDLCEIKKQDYLVIVDAYLGYPEVIPLSSQSSNAVIKEMKATFARHGIPDIVHSDNGPCYSSQEFADFKNKWGFKHITSSPHFPSSNGLVEKAVNQTVKNIITKSIEGGTDPFLGLLAYRSKQIDNQKTPAELLMGRKLETDLPIVENQLKVKDSKAKIRKAYHDRNAKLLPPLQNLETVIIYDQKKSIWGEKATVKEQVAPRSYRVETRDNVQYRRSRKHLRKVAPEVEEREVKESTSTRAEKQVEMKSLSGGRSIYGRKIKKPQRYEQ